MFQFSFAIPRTVCSLRVGKIPMPPALLAGHQCLCLPSSKPLEVQSTVSVPSWALRQSISPDLNDMMGEAGSRMRETWVQVLL